MNDAEKLMRRTFTAHEPELDATTEAEMFARIAAGVTRGADQHQDGDGSDSAPSGDVGAGISHDGGARRGTPPPPGVDDAPEVVELPFTGAPRRAHRFWLAGVAAGTLLATGVAVATLGLPNTDEIVGTVIGPRPTMTSAPLPTPTSGTSAPLPDTPGPLTPEQAAIVLASLDTALVRDGGTLQVWMESESFPERPLVYELDVRDPDRLRLQMVGGMIHIGDQHWKHEGSASSPDSFDTVWVEWTERERLPPIGKGASLLAFGWEYIWLGHPQVIGTDHIHGWAEVVGTETIGDLGTIRYRFTVELDEGGAPPLTLETWVLPDGRIAQAQFGSLDVEMDVAEDIRYGADVSVQPPPPGAIEMAETGP